METYLTYLIPIFAMAALAAGWMAVQLLAKRMEVKNHIDQNSGCCGACANKDACDRNN